MPAELMLVADAPGFHDDRLGRPLAGPTGELLDELLASIGLGARRRLPDDAREVPPARHAEPGRGRDRGLPRQARAPGRARAAARRRGARRSGDARPRRRPGRRSQLRGQVRRAEIGGHAIELLPLYHPAAALYNARLLPVLEGDVRRLGELLGRRRRAAGGEPPAAARARPDPATWPMSSSSASSEAETAALAAELAAALPPGAVVYVEGELGAGKTAFVRGAARALGVRGAVTSPTFTVAHLYDGREGRSRTSTSRAANGSTRRRGVISSRTSTTSAPSSWSGRASARACCRRSRARCGSPCCADGTRQIDVRRQ